jgi:pyridoxal 5'-phosphate synthase pdxS subunit
MRQVQSDMKKLTVMGQDELMAAAKEMGAPFTLVQQVAKLGKLPVPILQLVALPHLPMRPS